MKYKTNTKFRNNSTIWRGVPFELTLTHWSDTHYFFTYTVLDEAKYISELGAITQPKYTGTCDYEHDTFDDWITNDCIFVSYHPPMLNEELFTL